MAKATKETVDYWKEKIAEWKVSGLNRKEFCEKNGLNRSTAAYWFGKFLKADTEGGFVEISPSSLISNSKEGLKVIVRDKYKIEVTADNFNAFVFSEVVKVLENL